jgi:sn-glycerol 3-phosphate transport system permease protein
MVENRPWLTVFAHAVLIAGVIVIAFPLYVTFVASTLTLEQILQVPMQLVPGDQLAAQLLAGARLRLDEGFERTGVDDADEQPDHGARDRIGKIAISIIASFAIVYFNFPLRNFFFWMIFVTLMLPVEYGSFRRSRSSPISECSTRMRD